MWEYNSSLKDDELMHRSHKYISKHKGKSGKWIYVYANQASNAMNNTAAKAEHNRKENISRGVTILKTKGQTEVAQAKRRIESIQARKLKDVSSSVKRAGKRKVTKNIKSKKATIKATAVSGIRIKKIAKDAAKKKGIKPHKIKKRRPKVSKEYLQEKAYNSRKNNW